MTARSQSMPSCTQIDNPCPLQKPKGTIKTRGITAYDLLKDRPTLKIKRTQKEIQSVNKQFNHPKFIHILIDRKNGFGGKTLAKKHGRHHVQITKFLTEMGFSKIKPNEMLLSNGKKNKKDAQKIYEEEWMKEVESVKKDRTWARHPAVHNWNMNKKYYADPKTHNKKCMIYRANNLEKYKKNRRNWKPGYYKKNPSAKIADNLRSRLHGALKLQLAGKKVSAIDCGCTMDFLVKYLEQRFKPGMTWDNYGLYGWHIDHILPCASFDLTKKLEQKKCCHYTNLQPMWAKDNLSKGCKKYYQQELFKC
jgi:hypothetical protein